MSHAIAQSFDCSSSAADSAFELLEKQQPKLQADLRAGRVKLGMLTLPEDPFFWAGFVLIGEP